MRGGWGGGRGGRTLYAKLPGGHGWGRLRVGGRWVRWRRRGGLMSAGWERSTRDSDSMGWGLCTPNIFDESTPRRLFSELPSSSLLPLLPTLILSPSHLHAPRPAQFNPCTLKCMPPIFGPTAALIIYRPPPSNKYLQLQPPSCSVFQRPRSLHCCGCLDRTKCTQVQRIA